MEAKRKRDEWMTKQTDGDLIYIKEDGLRSRKRNARGVCDASMEKVDR